MERKWGFPRGNRRWISLQRGARISELLLVRFPSIYISIPLLSSSAQPPMHLFSFHKKSPYHHRRPNMLAWRRNVLFVYFCWQCYLIFCGFFWTSYVLFEHFSWLLLYNYNPGKFVFCFFIIIFWTSYVLFVNFFWLLLLSNPSMLICGYFWTSYVLFEHFSSLVLSNHGKLVFGYFLFLTIENNNINICL